MSRLYIRRLICRRKRILQGRQSRVQRSFHATDDEERNGRLEVGAARLKGEGELEDIIVSTPKQLVERFDYKAKTRTFPPLFSKLLTHGN
jgi:hypothetical protein